MKRTLLALAALVLVAAIGAGVWLYLSLDWVVKRAIEAYVPDIIGAEVKVAAVKLAPASGEGTVTGLVIGNPKGFKSPRAVSVGTVDIAIDPATVTKRVVVVRRIAVASPAITYEAGRNGSNFDVMRRNVEQRVGKPAPKARGAETRLIVERLTIRGATVNYVPELPVRGATISYSLPDIALANVGKRQGGVTPDELTKIVVDALIERMAKAMGRRALERGIQSLPELLGR
ncbi:MAG: hypothetical protein IT515_17925 [Burkholderiales bacterium]|nr:hypothetical protein [Burkholderiales bacterium]